MKETHLVTGAFGYSGSYIARELLRAGHDVRTLTRSPARENEFGDSVRVFPLDFDDRDGLVRALSGVRILYNTYWVRFAKAGFSQEKAVTDSCALFKAARDAGVRRIVHVSITNPSLESPYEYFRGKARLEKALWETGLEFSILRPAILFGGCDILINNIAWSIRRLPVIGVFGDGSYRVQPIHVGDLARLAVEQSQKTGKIVVDAVGPEIFTYRELVTAISAAIGKRRPVLSVPPWFGMWTSVLLGWIVRDIVLTREEMDAMMDDLLVSSSVPTGSTKLTEWMAQHKDVLGRRYARELARRSDRSTSYPKL